MSIPLSDATCQMLSVARAAGIQSFLRRPTTIRLIRLRRTTVSVPTIYTRKTGRIFELDPRVQRQEDERIVRKKYASAFKGTNLLDMLTVLDVDTLIVTGVSTSHCVYATCRDAAHTFRVVVPRQAVGEL